MDLPSFTLNNTIMKKSLLATIAALFILTGTKAQDMPSRSADMASNYRAIAAPSPYLVAAQLNKTGQDNPDAQVYLKRKRTFLTVGLILLGTGVVSSGIGLLYSNGNDINSDKSDLAATYYIIGAVTGIASIPFMSLSLAANNKYKAAIKSQPTASGLPRNVSKQVTGLTLSVPIGK